MSHPDTGNNLVWQHRLQSPLRDQTSPLTGGGLHKLYFYLQPAPQMHPYFYHEQCSCDSLIPGQQTRILLHCVSSMENIQQSRTGEKLSGFPLRHCLPEAADKGPPEDQEGINTPSLFPIAYSPANTYRQCQPDCFTQYKLRSMQNIPVNWRNKDSDFTSNIDTSAWSLSTQRGHGSTVSKCRI